MDALVTYLVAGIALGASYALAGGGLVVVYRITKVVNFAQGTLAVLGGLLASTLLAGGLPHGISEIVAVVITAAVGLVIGLIAVGKKGATPTTSLIVTLGLSIFAYAVIIQLWGAEPKSSPGLQGSVDLLGASIQWQSLLVIAVTATAFLGMTFLFGKTYVGRAMTACASNPSAAKLVGINVRAMGLLAFAIAGALGGLAGVMLTPLREVSYSSDIAFALNGFAAAVFGGLVSPIKTIMGGIILGVVGMLVAGYWDASYQMMVALVMMLGVMVIRSRTMKEEEAK